MRAAAFLLMAWGALVLPTPLLKGGRGGALGDRPSKLRFAESTYDFGTVIEGDEVSHVFRCRNTSSEDIRLLQSYGSCGCVAAAPETGSLIPAGGAAAIRVVFHTETKVGDQHANVRLWTDEGAAIEPIVLHVEGHVDRVVSVEPRTVFAELAPGEARNVEVHVQFLREVRRPDARPAGDLLGVEPDWESGLLDLHIRAPNAVGFYQDEVEVGFDLDTGRRELIVPVRMIVQQGPKEKS